MPLFSRSDGHRPSFFSGILSIRSGILTLEIHGFNKLEMTVIMSYSLHRNRRLVY